MPIDPTLAQLQMCIRKGTLTGTFVPVLGGSAFKNKGVEPLLDAVVAYLPAPGEVAADAGQPAADPDGPLAALAFKVVAESHGPMVFVRVYRGRLRPGDVVLNANNGKRERVARLYEVHANRHEERQLIEAGGIAGIVGLKATSTGHTLCDPEHTLVLEEIDQAQVAQCVLDLGTFEEPQPTVNFVRQAGIEKRTLHHPALRVAAVQKSNVAARNAVAMQLIQLAVFCCEASSPVWPSTM